MNHATILFETLAEIDESRLDMCAAREFELFSRSQYKQRVVRATINGREAKASASVRSGDHVVIEYLPEAAYSLEPEDIPLEILFEDRNVLVVNKARGMVVHPGAGNPRGTLVNAFLFHCAQDLKTGDMPADDDAVFRPGVVHRLDKDTSGVIILAKNSRSLEYLSSQFRSRETEKFYLAVVRGELRQEGELRGFIRRGDNNRMMFVHDDNQGKAAHTIYTPLASGMDEIGALTLVKLKPVTGRTHQLRVHMKHLGHPILGDPLYNRRSEDYPLMLHALSLSIRLPGNNDRSSFIAPPAPDMMRIFRELNFSSDLWNPESC